MNQLISKIKKFFSNIQSKKEKKDLLQQDKEEEKLFLQIANKHKLKVPSFKQLKHIQKVLSPKELLIIKSLLLIITGVLVYLGSFYFIKNTEVKPIIGGHHIEGMIGQPLYINPILSQTSDVDNDITHLIFSGLLKYDKNQQLIGDLATHYEISEDNLKYTFNLRNDVYWHDGEKLNADDIISTIEDITNPLYESPIFLSLKGVAFYKIDNYTIQFELKKPFAPFPSVLTFGIMPSHIWNNIETSNARLAEYNLKPIGTGAWKFKSLSKDKKGTIKTYTIERNDNYYNEKSYIETLSFKFYNSFEELIKAAENKKISGINFVPQKSKEQIKNIKHLNLKSLNFPQYTSIFFNDENNEFLKNKNLRKALKIAIPKDKIIAYALDEEGVPISGPILKGFIGHDPTIIDEPFDLEKANELLDKADFKKYPAESYFEEEKEKILKDLREELEIEYEAFLENNNEDSSENTPIEEETNADTNEAPSVESDQEIVNPEDLTDEELEELIDLNTINPSKQEFFRIKQKEILEILLTTVAHPENTKAVELIKDYWEKIGIKVTLDIIDPNKIQKEIIKKRTYEALLYGQNIGFDPDPFAFWHSSQIKDPGLNIAMFSNKEVDNLIIQSRQTTNIEARSENYKKFQEIIHEEIPAIFLYSPTYTYVMSPKIKGFNILSIIEPADRFNNINQWYIKTKRTWKK